MIIKDRSKDIIISGGENISSLEVEEALYREVGVHNGPTIKPIELKMGMVARHMTPDLARVMGELFADRSSREVERTMLATGLVPPGRAFIEKRRPQFRTG